VSALACRACGAACDPARSAICAACRAKGGRLAFCVACAQAHFCSADCRPNGCKAGLCTRLVVYGVVAERFGLVRGELLDFVTWLGR